MRIVWVQQLRQGIVFLPAELVETVSQIFAERDRTAEAANEDDFLIGRQQMRIRRKERARVFRTDLDLDVLTQRLEYLLLHNRADTGQALKKNSPDVVAANTCQYILNRN